MTDDYTYGDFAYESVTLVARGGSVPGPRHIVLYLDAADQADPRLLQIRDLVRSMQADKLAAWRASGSTSFGPIG